MSAKADKCVIDDIGWKILDELQRNGRISFKQLAEKVNLSVTATVERVRSMEDSGIIEGYGAKINAKKAGYTMSAMLHIVMNYNNPTEAIKRIIADTPEITSCWSITGTDDLIMEVQLPSLEFLTFLLTTLTKYGKVTTSIVLPGRFHKLSLQKPREIPADVLDEL